MQVVILAAGQGKRMRSDLPKVLQPLAGRPLLGHVLKAARAAAREGICVVYGHGGERVREAFADPAIAWARQEPQLGTGHAVQQAMPHLSDTGTVLVLYGDVPLIGADTLARLTAAAGADRLALLTVEAKDPSGYGRIIRDQRGCVQRIVEQKDASPDELRVCEINTGILVAPVARLRIWLERIGNRNAQGEYYLTDIVGLAVGDGVEVVTAHPGHEWETLGVNSKAQLAEMERIFQRALAERLLEQGVTLIDPSRIDIRGELVCGRDVEIDVNCVFEGRVELGDRVRVASHCVLRDVVVGAGSRINPFSHIEKSETGEDCQIGPYSRMRPGCRLGDDVHLGNFVEVKNSVVADHSKANHLAYVGDADIGSRVNVGAGTITCNYDGANKFRTVIEDDVFIGSDTQLVAPVRIGRGATLGAGTTLTADAPAGQLTLSRTKQVTIAGWKRPVKKK
ncbi:MAG: bifunctional UDP-N-acetylglucosamine diphosphorylase/glucosamine-1-phosphate N-acetyltransferase GlmU [Sterolibacteriaceae bacterium]|nr:bifunctional UDP-N-acetylglucosamine diphosphorylase/glucosamine-1-phosphate N-acetyltransferase GlmU [Candidatus Methylophosphatis haderslevensis]